MRPRYVLASVLLAFSGTALGQDLNFISAVEVKDEGSSVVVSVTGSKPPNFTTFSMADPPRFVLDLSEARFKGVPEDLPINDKLILVVKNLSYGSDATSIARIMIAFAVDVDPPDVQAQGSSLVVRIVKPTVVGRTAVAQADPAAAQRAREQEEAQRRAEAEAQAQAQIQAQAQAQAEAQARAEAEKRAQDEVQAKVAKDAELQAAELKAAEEARLADARRAQEEAQAKADALKQAEPKASEADAIAALDAELKAGDEARAARAREAQGESDRLEAIAAAKAEADRKKLEERDAKADAKRQRAEAIAAAKAEADRKKQEAAELKAEARQQREEAIAAAKREAGTTASAQVREIGFRQMPGVSRVFLRTSVPPRFTIQDVGENLIRVELENTRVARRNDARFLDTSFFASAVALITPSRQGSTYVVEIKLKQKVPYQQKIEGDMLAIDFERPAAGAAAGAPAPEAPPAVAGDAAADR